VLEQPAEQVEPRPRVSQDDQRLIRKGHDYEPRLEDVLDLLQGRFVMFPEVAGPHEPAAALRLDEFGRENAAINR
jgi:hypothetical protein